MFGKRSNPGLSPAQPGAAPPPARRRARVRDAAARPAAPERSAPHSQQDRRSDSYFQTKSMIFGALIEAIDLAALAKLDPESAREEIRDIVHEIVAIKNLVLSISEQEDLLDDICNDVLGYGPLEPLLARDDIADIMVNGPDRLLHRSRRQDPAHQRPLSRQRAADEHLPAHRQPGRPPRRRSLADLRRAPARRLARQRHRAAAGDRRPGADHPQVQEGQADARPAGALRLDFARRRGNPQDHRPRAAATSSSPAAPARARRRCSTA